MREYLLMKNAISKFSLELSGKTVFTEAASNCFTWTPIIAALGGAKKVFAVTAPSGYAEVKDVIHETMSHAINLGVSDRIKFCTRKLPEHIAQADIVTNLGFVRPIDASFINRLKQNAVICLMWEPWEFRPSDIDLAACKKRNIAILGTNEHDERLQTYRYVAMTVVKLLLEHNIEIFDTDILLLGSGHFFPETKELLENMGARVISQYEGNTGAPDCIVCLEHEKKESLIGAEGMVKLDSMSTTPLVIHVCGDVDLSHLDDTNTTIVPPQPASCGTMSFSTGHVGPKPVIDLHTAGLKIGQAWQDQDKETLEALALPLPQLPLDNFPNNSTKKDAYMI